MDDALDDEQHDGRHDGFDEWVHGYVHLRPVATSRRPVGFGDCITTQWQGEKRRQDMRKCSLH